MEHYFTNNDNLKSEIKKLTYSRGSSKFTFFSDNGVFSKDKIDYGSQVLVENVLKSETRKNLNILDVGCGYGYIGIVLANLLNSKVLMTDINQRALHLAQKNISENKVDGITSLSDAYNSVTDKFDLIVTNPPIRAGKKKVLEILLGAKNYLNCDGYLWFVIRKDQGVLSILKILESDYEYEIVERSKGFFVIKAKNH